MALEHLNPILKDALSECQIAFLSGYSGIRNRFVGLLNGFHQFPGGFVDLCVGHGGVPFLAFLCEKRDNRYLLIASICILHLYAYFVKVFRSQCTHNMSAVISGAE